MKIRVRGWFGQVPSPYQDIDCTFESSINPVKLEKTHADPGENIEPSKSNPGIFSPVWHMLAATTNLKQRKQLYCNISIVVHFVK